MIFAEETGWRKGKREEPEVLLFWMADSETWSKSRIEHL